MKSNIFINLIKNKTQIQEVETAELKTIVEEYPYFQAARVLYLKGLKNQDSFKYNNELKVTAAYTTDRTLLFNYITTTNFNNQKENIHQQIFEKISAEKTIATPSKIIETPIKKAIVVSENIVEIETTLEIGKPISL